MSWHSTPLFIFKRFFFFGGGGSFPKKLSLDLWEASLKRRTFHLFGSAVVEILRYTQVYRSCFFYIKYTYIYFKVNSMRDLDLDFMAQQLHKTRYGINKYFKTGTSKCISYTYTQHRHVDILYILFLKFNILKIPSNTGMLHIKMTALKCWLRIWKLFL